LEQNERERELNMLGKRQQRFPYLRDVALKYGSFWLAREFESFAATATPEQLMELAAAYDEICRREDVMRISRWMADNITFTDLIGPPDREYCQQVGQLFLLFDHLADKNIAPFASRQVRYIERVRIPDWTNVPEVLRYLIPFAEKYGKYVTESNILDFLDRAGEIDMEQLASAAEQIRLNGHHRLIDDWLQKHSMVEHEEASLFFWLLMMLDHADLSFE
jgi:hypothetical protein